MTIFYPDISDAQTGINLKGAVAVCCKATQSTNYTNADYARAKANAAENGVYFFAYHFLVQGPTPAAQAAYCFKVVGKTPLMLDVEQTTNSNPTVADAQEFVDAFRKLGGIINLLYLPRWYWGDLGSPSLAGVHERGLRIVSSAYTTYSDSAAATGWEPYGGITPTIWQFTENAVVNGRVVDRNAFRGTLAQLKSIVETGKMPPIIQPPQRHVVPAGNDYTLDGVAREAKTTVASILATSKAHLNATNLAVFDAYLALRDACKAALLNEPGLPEGLVYWTAS